LIRIQTTKDKLGQDIKTETESMIFCSILSITRSEFATSGQLGFKPDLMFIIDGDSYGDEKLLSYQGKNYSIYKTYRRTDGFIEVYAEVKIGD
jgi:hypothetical protein